MPIGPARMPIMDHLGELRRRVTIIVVAVIVCALIVYMATPTLIELMMDQIEEAMRGQELVVISVLGGFTIRFKVASSCRRSSPRSASGSCRPSPPWWRSSSWA